MINLLVVFFQIFNTVDHEVLIAKLNHYRIRGVALECLQSYVTNWPWVTLIEGELPEETI